MTEQVIHKTGKLKGSLITVLGLATIVFLLIGLMLHRPTYCSKPQIDKKVSATSYPQQTINSDIVKLRQLADAGNTKAMNNLAACYKNGEGVPEDEAEAVVWFRKAADHGDAYAMYNLGLCYANGTGVSWDQGEAAKWQRKAADLGDADAQRWLDKVAAKEEAEVVDRNAPRKPFFSVQTIDALQVIGAILFLILSVLGFYQWDLDRLVLFTGWVDMVVTGLVLVFWIALGIDQPGPMWIAGGILLIGAWRANDRWWKVVLALPARISAIILLCLAVGIVLTVVRAAISELSKLFKRVINSA